MDKTNVNAVYEDDLVEFLRSIDEYERLMNKKAKCYFCDKTITIKNIQTIFPLNKDVSYCCNNPLCFIKYERTITE